MKEKVLILGGTRFVGRQLIEKLILDNSYDIYIFNRGRTNADLFPTVNKIIGDRETDDINQIKDNKWDYVVDFSSYHPEPLSKTISCLNRDLKKYIYISTISVYDFEEYDSSFLINEDYKIKTWTKSDESDRSMVTYGKRKAACEKVLHGYSWLQKIILRPAIIYGKYDYTERFYYWLYRLKAEQAYILPNSGSDRLTLSYAGDLVKTIICVLKSDVVQGTYNCTTHEPLELKGIIDIMESALRSDSKAQATNIAEEWLKEHDIQIEKDFPLLFKKSLIFDSSRIKNDFGLKFLAFEKTIENVIDYYSALNWNKSKAGLSTERELKLLAKYREEQEN